MSKKRNKGNALQGTTTTQDAALASALAVVAGSSSEVAVTSIRRNGKLVSAPVVATVATVTPITAKADAALAEALAANETLQAGIDALVVTLQRIAMLRPTGSAQKAVDMALEILAPLKAAASA